MRNVVSNIWLETTGIALTVLFAWETTTMEAMPQEFVRVVHEVLVRVVHALSRT